MNRISSREEELFTDALAQPAAKRAAFLEQACGADAALRGRLDALLAAHAGPDSLAAPAAPQFALIPDERPGDMIGRYKLLQRIGEGGCGVVYLAEQAEPVRRRVALKVIKAGMDTHEVMARFAAERQALALMEHPGIAQVLDAGATDAGRPFFVMELVRGVPITRYCDTQSLSTAARLELFMQVCHAVQHAHQKGIIHRDLKPSNILVTLNDTTAVPKVIDFGIAKATQGRLTDATLVTALDQFIGTPAYMSPEQAERTGLDIDTRTDVYSLGVVLYELLAGCPPFDPKSFVDTSREELRRIIREVEPPRPSRRLATLADTDRSVVAKSRDTDPAKLSLLLQGDLDWIVMKALEKNRARRYESPNALAADIERFLGNQPVLARPPSTLYRIGKFTRRHRAGVAAVAAIIFLLVAGIIASTWQLVRATRAEHVAVAERSKAVGSRMRAESLLGFMLGELRTEVKKAGKLDLLDMVGDKATAYFASLDPRDENDTALLQQATMLRQIGESQLLKAQYGDATRSFETAYKRSAALVERHPGNGEMLYERAQAEYGFGAAKLRQGDAASASAWWTRYRDTTMAFAPLDPGNLLWQRELIAGHHNLAVLELDRDRLAVAHERFLAELQMVEKLCAANPNDRGLQLRIADVVSFLGTVAERSGNYPEALTRFAEQTARIEALLAKEPTTMHWRYKLADSLVLQSEVLAITDRRAEARERLERANALYASLVEHDPANRQWLIASFTGRLKEGNLAKVEGRTGDASRIVSEVRPKVDALAAVGPPGRTLLAASVTAWRLEAELRFAAGREDAGEAINRAVHFASKLVGEARADSKILGECAQARLVAGVVSNAAGQPEAASDHWRQAFELLKSRLADSNDWRVLDPAARALGWAGRADDSRAIIGRLDSLGYRPLQPWFAPASPDISVSPPKNK